MLILDSWSPLVTATCCLHSRHSFSRSYGADLPNSLNLIIPSRLGLFSQGHLCQILVRSLGPLFTGSGVQPAFAITYSPVSRHDGSPQDSMLGRRDDAARSAPKRQDDCPAVQEY